jgi:uncharacterized protein (UPF0276 family)
MIAQFEGFGLGLRRPHYREFIDGAVKVDFIEAISENFMVKGGRPLHTLRSVRKHYPIALHGVAMSLGSADGLDPEYLEKLKILVDDIEPLFVSDHLSWSRIGGLTSHDLLPLPFNSEALDIFASNLGRAQDVLKREMLVENPSTYMAFESSTMSEAEFLSELCRRTGCHLLLDVNNIFVSCTNLGEDPRRYIDALPLSAVRQVHLAGHSKGRELLIDTHDEKVCDEVWSLYDYVSPRLAAVATMIERDDDIPPLGELLDELELARHFRSQGKLAAA